MSPPRESAAATERALFSGVLTLPLVTAQASVAAFGEFCETWMGGETGCCWEKLALYTVH